MLPDISYGFQKTQLELTVQPLKDDSQESPDQENIPDSLLWENTKCSSWRKSGQAQKLDIYDCLRPPSHEWLLHKQDSDHWMKVEEGRQSQLCINIFSASGPVNFIRIEFHTFFQKYPTQAFLSLLPGLSLISLAKWQRKTQRYACCSPVEAIRTLQLPLLFLSVVAIKESSTSRGDMDFKVSPRMWINYSLILKKYYT